MLTDSFDLHFLIDHDNHIPSICLPRQLSSDLKVSFIPFPHTKILRLQLKEYLLLRPQRVFPVVTLLD